MRDFEWDGMDDMPNRQMIRRREARPWSERSSEASRRQQELDLKNTRKTVHSLHSGATMRTPGRRTK